MIPWRTSRIPTQILRRWLAAGHGRPLPGACNSGAPAVQLNSGQPAPTFQTFAADGTPVHFPGCLCRQAAGHPLLGRLVQVLRRRNEGDRDRLPAPPRHRAAGAGSQCRAGQAGGGRVHQEDRRQLPGAARRAVEDRPQSTVSSACRPLISSTPAASCAARSSARPMKRPSNARWRNCSNERQWNAAISVDCPSACRISACRRRNGHSAFAARAARGFTRC